MKGYIRVLPLLFTASSALVKASPTFHISLGSAFKSAQPVTGRVLLYISRNNESEPRAQCMDDQPTSQVFGIDAVDLTAGDMVSIDETTLGYPRASTLDLHLAKGDVIYVQAELKRYELYSRSGLPSTYLPTTCVDKGGSDGSYGSVPGTLYSDVIRLEFDGSDTKLELSHEVPEKPGPGCAGNGQEESEYIKTVRVKSALLSAFWGRDIVLESCVLLPYGFNEHPDARYPLVVAHGHYSPEFDIGGRFSPEAPSPDLQGYDLIAAQYAYYLYQNWTMPDQGPFHGARMLIVTVNHPVPFFDDSYAVNSESMGPYGDAIMRELLPAIEAKYRGLGQGWARAAMGGSTGGWESMAVQVFYPDDFNGAYAACPDPITFTSYTSIDIYSQKNAYYYDSDWKRTELPAERDEYSGHTIGYGHPYGRIQGTVREVNQRELVLGEHSRSCGQWDIWEAVFSPVDPATGFPVRLYDKKTGAINSTVAEHWREHYDLLHILQRDWSTLGPKLKGKLHLYVGASDTFYLTNAVMDAEDWFGQQGLGPDDVEVVIGAHKGRGYEHCYSGDAYWPDGSLQPNSITRLTYAQRLLPNMAAHFVRTAPEGADVQSWRY